jgi:CHAT domain-containing protein/Tfp pilus assembly protein PilF
LAAALSWAATAAASGRPRDSGQETGVIVESVEAGYAAEKAGLQPGDEILSWSRAASSAADLEPRGGRIQSPYDLMEVEFEQTYRWAVTLSGLHGSQQTTWTLPRGSWWRITTRPGLPSQAAALYHAGKEKIAAGDLPGGEALWRTAATDLAAAGDRLRAAWLLERSADKLSKAEKWAEADAAYEAALGALGPEADPSAAVRILISWGESSIRHSAWDHAASCFDRALALRRKAVPGSLSEAEILVSLGDTAWLRGDLAAAETFHRQAMEIYEDLAPESLNVASLLNNWASVLVERGDLNRAEADFRRADEILRRLDPGAFLHGLIFGNLGAVMYFRGDLAEAERLFRQALTIYEKQKPDGGEALNALNNLGEVAHMRGDLATSEDLLLRSLHLVEKAGTRLALVGVLGSLGRVARDRGDLDVAETRFRRALEIAEAQVPGSPLLADALTSFADLARRRGDYTSARDALRRALAIQEQQAPGSFHVAEVLLQLAAVELASGENLAAAEDGFRRARALLEDQVPGSPALAEALRGLGELAARRGQLQQAIELYRQALTQVEKTGVGTAAHAELLHVLGRAERRAALAGEGLRHLCAAFDVLDRQRRKLGGTEEVRAAFETSTREIYYGCLEALLAEGRPAEAFATLERGRARSFLDLLAERDLEIPGLAPETEAERRRIGAEYDRVQAELLASASASPPAAFEELQEKLRDLRTQQERLAARIRRESPRFASLRYPEPLALNGAGAALDPGTVLLSYSVGPERSFLFVVRPAVSGEPGLTVHSIAIGESALRGEVESFRRLLKRPGSDRAALKAQARRLYDLLVRPAEGQITRATRLLVSPDGPLHTLPFAALMRRSRYLVQWKPIHSVLSATVYAELARSRPGRQEPGEQRLTAFGDPVYPSIAPAVAADPEVREAVRRGLALKPLPETRLEVESIADLYPQAQTYLGRDATEERAKSLGPETRLVHFACHGLLDERFPLNSALALAIPEHPAPGQDNGLLQAWEILESVRLDADLVTLSACDTALGKEMGGEGLVGVTRAFQFAGARSVLASLWSISDVSTARFMKRFYGYLRGGRTKDEALRAAQIDQIREKSASSHPFHWAAFELFGDWR